MPIVKAPVILVDGSSYLYRAYHGMPPLKTSKGQMTHAIRGVISMLKKLIKDYQPSHMAVVMDAKGKTFRHDLFSEYKAHRPPMPEDLASQIPELKEALMLMGLPPIEMEGVEADDVIGSLARQITAKGDITCLISTGDKDLAQLVTAHVTLINTMDNVYLDEVGVKNKFEVTPLQMIDLLALQGDSSDNIPGMPGVGEKTAKALIAAFGSVQAIYQNLDQISSLKTSSVRIRGADKLKQKFIDHKALVDLSYLLATIRTDLVTDEFNLESIRIKDIQKEGLLFLYEKLEFKGWIDELKRAITAASKNTPKIQAATEAPLENSNQEQTAELPEKTEQAKKMDTYETIFTFDALNAWIQRIEKAGVFALDTETTGLDYMNAELVGISCAVERGACYIPLQHVGENTENQLPLNEVLARLKPLLESEKTKKIGQNIKYDHQIFKRYNIELQGIAFDTMLESYVLDSTGSRHDLDTLSLKHLDHKTITFDEVAGKGAKQINFSAVAIPEAARYAAEDADITFQLHHLFWKRLNETPSLLNVYQTLEQPLIKVLSKIERCGALIDTPRLQHHSEALGIAINVLEKRIFEAAGFEFNTASPKQLGTVLYEKLSLPILRKTPKGAPSTAEDVLEDLAHYHELPKLIVEQRGLIKLKNTYTDKLPLMVDACTKRVHTSYHQAVAATGRLSSSDPNLQNIPVKNQEGRQIRKAFIAPEGCRILSLDYSQIELRIMAHLSADETLVRAFKQGQDIHKATASEVFSVDVNHVTAEMRRQAKAINFGLMYGMSAFGLSKQLGFSHNESQAFIALYFEKYPGVKRYMDNIRTQAHEHGYVETLSGRRLYLPEISSKNKMKQAGAERTAINAPLQGTAADIIKIAMIQVDEWLTQNKLATKMIMQVHDELVFEVPEAEINQAKNEIKIIMENSMRLSVPLVVDAGVGLNWDEAH